MLETGSTCGQRLRISFPQYDDRLAHTIGVLDGQRLIPVFASHEGTADEQWPASPVFQEIQVNGQAGISQVALLVGMAGSSHWSASVEVSTTSAKISFDVACRFKSEPTQLISTYRTMTSATIVDLHEALIDISEHPLCVQNEPVDGVQSILRVTKCGLCVDVALASSSYPRTIRWKYSISVE